MRGTPPAAALSVVMHRIPPFDVEGGTRPCESDLVSRSPGQVAEGGSPLLRMKAPTCSFDGSGEAFVYLAGKRLAMADLSVLGTINDAVTNDVAARVGTWRPGVIFADRTALAATMKVLGGSPAGGAKARAIAYLCRLPMNGQYAVLTDALAMRFVPPGPANALSTWRAAFHLEGLPTPELLVRLAKEAAAGETEVISDAISNLRHHGKEAMMHLFAGRSKAIDAYKAVTRHGDLWAAVQHTDPLLRTAYLDSGDTVAAVPFKPLGGLVECRVSTPFKIRPGSAVLVWRDGESGLPATLVALGFDPEAECLTAKFAPPATGKRRRNGYDALFDATVGRGQSTTETFYVTTQPFTGSAPPGGGRGHQGSWSSGRSVTRELPLFVSLAAVAQPQGSSE